MQANIGKDLNHDKESIENTENTLNTLKKPENSDAYAFAVGCAKRLAGKRGSLQSITDSALGRWT